MSRKKFKSRLMWEIFLYISFAMIISLCVYVSADSLSLKLLENYVSQPAVFKDISDDYFEEFQSYVKRNGISSHDGKKIAQWNDSHDHLSILISDEQKMIYNSFVSYMMYFDDEENEAANPSGAFDWGTKSLPVHVYYVQLSDETAKMRISGYYELHFETVRKAGSLTLMLLSFTITFTLLFSKKLRYIEEIEAGINQIRDGQYSHSIPVRGNDELAGLSKNINILSETVDMYIRRELDFQSKKDDMVRSIAHDIRTPLTTVMGYLEVLKEQKLADPETHQLYAQRAYSSAIHINDLVEDLFGVEDGDFESAVQVEKFDCLELFSQLMIDMIDTLQEKGFSVNVDNNIEPNLSLFININHLARVFHNISSNIIRYGDSAFPVTIHASVTEQSLELVLTNIKACHTGEKGLGIGLKSCHSIMQLHNGTLKTENSDNRFKVILSFPIVR